MTGGKNTWGKKNVYSMMRHVRHNHQTEEIVDEACADYEIDVTSKSDCSMEVKNSDLCDSLAMGTNTECEFQQPQKVETKDLYPYLTSGGKMMHEKKGKFIEHILFKIHRGLDFIPNELEVPADHQFAHLLHAKFVYKLTHSQAYEFSELTKVMLKQHEARIKKKLKEEILNELFEDGTLTISQSTEKRKRECIESNDIMSNYNCGNMSKKACVIGKNEQNELLKETDTKCLLPQNNTQTCLFPFPDNPTDMRTKLLRGKFSIKNLLQQPKVNCIHGHAYVHL